MCGWQRDAGRIPGHLYHRADERRADVPRRRRRAAARRARAGERDSRRPRRGLAPLLVLAGIVLAAFALYTWLASLVDVPRVHPDEVRYLIAASSLVEGEGLTLRGDEYGFGPLYALVLAAILWLSSGVDPAYDLWAANALFFALTAVPVYLLARRLVSPWWAVCAAGLAVAIPSSISVATVMTESLAYLTSAWALYATALALERPTLLRQLAVLGTVAAAFLTRAQLGGLYLSWLLGLALLWMIVSERGPGRGAICTGSGRAPSRSCWPCSCSRAGWSAVPRRPSRSAPTGSSGAATTRSRC